MIKRFVIAAIIVAVFLGGVGYFNLVFKPKMIAEFIGKMVPPPATVTAENGEDRAAGSTGCARSARWSPSKASTWRRSSAAWSPTTSSTAARTSRRAQSSFKLDTLVEEADLANNKATLHQANLDYERQSKLVKTGAVSQAVLDANHRQARFRRGGGGSMWRRSSREKTIIAPFAGRLGLRHVEKGQYVTAGQALVWLQALDPIWVDFPVPEADVGKVKIGTPIEIAVDAFRGSCSRARSRPSTPSSPKTARMLMVRAQAAQSRPQAAARHVRQYRRARGRGEGLRHRAAHGAHLRSVRRQRLGGEGRCAGAGARLRRPTAASEPVASAVAADAAPTGSIPAQPKLTVERRFVHVGPTEGDRVAILDGIKEGEQVVTSGQLKLQPGATIKVDNSRALQAPAELPKQ